MNLEEKRYKEIKGLIISKGFIMKEFAREMGYTTYEGFKRAIKANRKNKYFEAKKRLESL